VRSNDNGGRGIPLGNSAKATARGADPLGKETSAIGVRPVGDLERGKDLELVTGRSGRSASSATLTGHDSWNANKRSHLDNSSEEELGRIRVTDEVRVEVVRSNV
jgi:hypothetical protein